MSTQPPGPLLEGATPPRRRRRWLHILKWAGIAIAIAVAGVVAGLWMVANYGPVHRFALEKIQSVAADVLGGPVRIREFHLRNSLTSPSVDLYDIVVPGAAPYVSPPLLRVDHVHVGLTITSLLHRTWQVNEITVDHPVVYFVSDAECRTNIPHRQNAGSSSGPDMFALGIRHLAVNRGQITVNQRKNKLEADLHEVYFQAVYHSPDRGYDGSFAYRDGRLQLSNFRPIPNDLSLTFHVTATGMDLSDVRLRAAGSQMQAAVELRDYEHPAVVATYQMNLDATRAGSLLKVSALPRGTVHVEGTASYQAPRLADEPSGVQAVKAEGRFSSGRLDEASAGLRVPVRSLSGTYALHDGDLSVNDIRAEVVGGQLEATATVRELAGAATGQAQVHLAGAHIGSIGRTVLSKQQNRTLGELGITGVAGADARLNWRGDFEHLEVRSTASIHAQILPAVAVPAAVLAPAIPIDGVVHARFAQDHLELTDTAFRTAASSVSANGSVATNGRHRAALTIQAQSRDLAEMETVADRILHGLTNQRLPPQGLAGTASLHGRLSGSLAAPSFAGNLHAANLHVHQTVWRSVALDVAASPDQVTVTDAVLALAQGGEIRLSGHAGLHDWNFRDQDPVQLDLSIRRLALRQFEPLTGPLPVSGILTTQVTIHGTVRNPIGEGSVRVAPAHLRVGSKEEPIESIAADLHGNGEAIHAAAMLTLAAGKIQAQATYEPDGQRYEAQIHSTGIALDRLLAVQNPKLDLTGALALNGQGAGTIANPQFQLTVSTPTLTVAHQAMTDLTLQAEVANHVARLVLASNAVATSIRGEATIQLRPGYDTTAKLDTQTIPLAPLIAVYAPGLAGNITGETQVHATLEGPLARMEEVKAQIEVPVLQIHYGETVRVAAAQPVRLTLAGDVLTLEPATLKGENTNVVLAGEVPLANGATMGLSANGSVDLKLMQAFAPDLVTGGELRLNVRVTGTLQNPNAEGDISISDFSLTDPTLPVSLSRTNGSLKLNGNRITITSLNGSVGGGTLAATGGVTLGEATRFDVGVKLDKIRLVYPPTLRETVGGTLTFTGNTDTAMLAGRIQVEDVSVTPQFDFTEFIGNLSSAGGAASAPGSFAQNCRLNIAVTTPNEIQIVSRDFSMQAGANVTARGTLAEPVILGRVNLNGGDLIFRGNRYVVQSGTLDFVNPNETQPVVNVTADTTIQQYDLHLRFTGPADNLHTAYTSDPALPPADIINLLAFGQTTEASAANSAPGNLGAENLIASAVSSQITDRVQRIAGISQLSVDPVLGGGQQNAGARITIQQRVTGNLFVTISTDVTSTQRNVIEIQYKLSPKVSISGIRKQNGGFGINTRFKRSW